MKRFDLRATLLSALVGGILVLAVLLLTSRGDQRAATMPLSSAPAEGVAARATPLPAVAGSPSALTGCFRASQLQPAGRQPDGHPQYVLTLTLGTDPDGEAGAARLLAAPDCAASLRTAIAAADKSLALPEGDAHLSVTFLTPAGSRLILPQG